MEPNRFGERVKTAPPILARLVLIATLGAILFMAIPPSHSEEGKAEEPFLAAWIHLNHLFRMDASLEEREIMIGEALDDLARSGLRIAMPFALTSSGLALYPSEIAPRSAHGEWDPLGVLVREARARGLGVYVALPLLVSGHDTPRGVLLEHPEWAVRGAEGEPLGYVCGGNLEAREWLVSLAREVVRKYQPDGLMLDYLRFPNKPVDLDAATRARFLAESGIQTYDLAAGKTPELQEFKERSLVDLAGMIRRGVEEERPGTRLGIYCWGPHVVKDHNISQDWVTMAKKGYLDIVNVSGYIYPEKYGEKYRDRFFSQMKNAKELLPPGSSDARLAFVLGVKTSHGELRSAEEIERFLRMGREAGMEGLSVFTLTYLQPYIDGLLKTGGLDVPRD